MNQLVRQVLSEKSYPVHQFNSYWKGLLYDDEQLSMNIFLKVLATLSALYKTYPSALYTPHAAAIQACSTDQATPRLIIDPASYHIINHTCWTQVATQLYYSVPNSEEIALYENPLQMAFIPAHSLTQLILLILVFFTLLIQFV